MDLNPAVLAIIGTGLGGIFLKVTDSILSRNKNQVDQAAQIRTELRTDLQSLREEVRVMTEELDKWKSKYYVLLDQFYKKGIIPEDSVPSQ